MSRNDTPNKTLSGQRAAFVVALLEGKTIEAAAEAVGVARRTAYRWLEQDAVRAALRDGQGQTLDQAARLMISRVKVAQYTLTSLMTKENSPSVRLRAAQAVIDAALRLRDAAQVEERLQALEAALQAHESEGA